MINVVWKTDWRTEQWLAKEKAKHEWCDDISLAHIDNSPKNIRLLTHGKFDDDSVLSMAISMEQGDAFPAPVLWRRQSGRYEPINGAHRIKGAEAYGVKKISAYIIDDPDPNFIDQLRRTANTIESTQGYSNQERLEQALMLVERDNITAKAAAEKLKLKASLVSERLRAKKVTKELLDEGVPEALVRELPITERKDLHVIRNPQVRALVVKLSHESRLPVDERKVFYKEVSECLSEKDAHAVIDEWKKKVASRYKVSNQKRSPFSKLATINHYISDMEKQIKAEKVPPNIQQVIEELERTSAHTAAMAKMLRRLYDKAA